MIRLITLCLLLLTACQANALTVGYSRAFPASYLFNIDHEENNFSEYNATSTGGGALSVSSAAALKSTSYGLSAYSPGTTNAILYAQKNVTLTSKLRIRFYYDPNSYAQNDYTASYVFLLRNTTNTLYLKQSKVGTSYRLALSFFNDAGTATDDTEVFTDAPHYIEIYVVRASTADANDGTVEWWIDGTSKGSWTGIDNYTKCGDVNNLKVGHPLQAPAGDYSGTIFLDEIVANDTGVTIGP